MATFVGKCDFLVPSYIAFVLYKGKYINLNHQCHKCNAMIDMRQ